MVMEFNPKNGKSCSVYALQIKAGDVASQQGKSILDNPYQEETPDGMAWAHGWWTSGEADLAKLTADLPARSGQ